MALDLAQREITNYMIEAMDFELARLLVSLGLASYDDDGSLNYSAAENHDTMVVILGDNGTLGNVVKLPFNPAPNLFAGFYAIINAMNGNFYVAAAAVFVAMVLDGLDGRVARLTNTQSAFGAEYDSLSDMVAFGVAPALLAFEWALGSMGKVGWMVAFIYVAGAALRLARFNTQIGSVDKRYFIGLASPAAAGVVAGTVWAFSDFGIKGSNMAFAVAILVAAAGVLMVSNIKYHSFKDLDLKGRVPFVAILVVVLIFAVVFSDPPRILLIIFLAYAASGPIQYLLQLRRRKTTE
jgi:CDP-diacylglycerol--serine O-phosphatidyltransferase